jgi:hypothetical protein
MVGSVTLGCDVRDGVEGKSINCWWTDERGPTPFWSTPLFSLYFSLNTRMVREFHGGDEMTKKSKRSKKATKSSKRGKVAMKPGKVRKASTKSAPAAAKREKGKQPGSSLEFPGRRVFRF